MATTSHLRRSLVILSAIAAIVICGAIPAFALDIAVPTITVTPPSLDIVSTPLPTATPAAVDTADPASIVEDPNAVVTVPTVDPNELLDPSAVIDPVTGLIPGSDPGPTGDGGGGGGNDGGNDDQNTTDPSVVSDPAGTGSIHRSGGTTRTRSTGAAGEAARSATEPYGNVAAATFLHAAGRALELTGPLAVPLLFGIAAIGFLIAVSGRPARLLKGDRLPFRRSYRI